MIEVFLILMRNWSTLIALWKMVSFYVFPAQIFLFVEIDTGFSEGKFMQTKF